MFSAYGKGSSWVQDQEGGQGMARTMQNDENPQVDEML